MAITLPYPDLVFVPLDKLTAEEMNEIVANYTAIANVAGAIKSYAKVENQVSISLVNDADFATLDISSVSTGSTVLIIGQCRTSLGGGVITPAATVCVSYGGQNSVSSPTLPASVIAYGAHTGVLKVTKVSGSNTVTWKALVAVGEVSCTSYQLIAVDLG